MKNSVTTAIDNVAHELATLKRDFDMLLYVGRFCPVHLGHQVLMGGMIKAFPENHAILIGSCNEEMSLRNLFNFTDRHDFIRILFPESRIAAIPDFNDDESWFNALDGIIRLAGVEPSRAAFIGGCEEDVAWYYRNSRNVHIVNRFSGTTINVSGTEIRDHLISRSHKKLLKLLSPKIVDLVCERFDLRWNEFRRM